MLSGGSNLIRYINISSVVELIDDGVMREGSGGSASLCCPNPSDQLLELDSGVSCS